MDSDAPVSGALWGLNDSPRPSMSKTVTTAQDGTDFILSHRQPDSNGKFPELQVIVQRTTGAAEASKRRRVGELLGRPLRIRDRSSAVTASTPLAPQQGAQRAEKRKREGDDTDDDVALAPPPTMQMPPASMRVNNERDATNFILSHMQHDDNPEMAEIHFHRVSPLSKLRKTQGIGAHRERLAQLARRGGSQPALHPPPSRPSSSAAATRPALQQGSTDEGQPSHKRRKGGNGCGNCNIPGHKVKRCAGPVDDDGYIHACPIHNTRSHTLAECRSADNMSVAQLYQHLVVDRVNLPPLYCQYSWESIVMEFIQTGSIYTDEDALPFSCDFSVTIPREKIDAYNYGARDPACLGHEPETANIAALKIWYNAITEDDAEKDHVGDVTMADIGELGIPEEPDWDFVKNGLVI